jgi:PST family polysaccharide transporter
MSRDAREAIRSWATIGAFSAIKGVVIIGLYKAIANNYSKPELLLFSQLYSIILILATLPSGITSTATIRYYTLNPTAFSLIVHRARPFWLAYLVGVLASILLFASEISHSAGGLAWLSALATPLAVFGVLFNIFVAAVENAKTSYIRNGLVTVLSPAALCLVMWVGRLSVWNALFLACIASGLLSLFFFQERKGACRQLRSLISVPLRWKLGKSVTGLVGSSLVSSAGLPLSFYVLRRAFAAKYGADYAANMQAVIRVSESYMYVFGTVMSVYFFPRIAAKVRVASQLALYMGGVAAAMLILYVLRKQVIGLLFNARYLEFSDALAAFLVADFFRLITVALNLRLISHSRYGAYLLAELTFSSAMVALTLVACFVGRLPSWSSRPFGLIYVTANLASCAVASLMNRIPTPRQELEQETRKYA